jgi:hypothetical protein
MKKVVWECDNCKGQVVNGNLPVDWVTVEVSGTNQKSITFHWCTTCWMKIKGPDNPPVRKIKVAGRKQNLIEIEVEPEEKKDDDEEVDWDTST